MKKLLWPNIGILLEGLGKTVKGSREANFPVGIGTEDLPNVSHELYRYITKFSKT
jgi:hypothetical protein